MDLETTKAQHVPLDGGELDGLLINGSGLGLTNECQLGQWLKGQLRMLAHDEKGALTVDLKEKPQHAEIPIRHPNVVGLNGVGDRIISILQNLACTLKGLVGRMQCPTRRAGLTVDAAGSTRIRRMPP